MHRPVGAEDLLQSYPACTHGMTSTNPLSALARAVSMRPVHTPSIVQKSVGYSWLWSKRLCSRSFGELIVLFCFCFLSRIETFFPTQKKLMGNEETVATLKNKEKLIDLEKEQKVRKILNTYFFQLQFFFVGYKEPSGWAGQADIGHQWSHDQDCKVYFSHRGRGEDDLM